jgi:uncharacterized caspase-like protein
VTPEASDAQQERGMQVVAKDPESGLELNLYDKMWAVVVGINKYQNWPRLRYAVQDADAIAKMLTTKYGFRQDYIILLKDNEATLQGMKDAFQTLINKTETDDGVLFFFAGHGQTFQTKEGKEMGFLIPVDGKLGDDRLYTSSLSMSEVKTLSNLVPAKHMLFLVDACYSGLAASADYRGSLSPTTKGFLKKVTKAKTRHIITAGSAGEQVQEREEWGHSAFTYEMLNALEREQADEDNDDIVTADELAGYLTSRVSLVTDNAQLPVSRRLSADEGKFVFVSSHRGIEKAGGPRVEATGKSSAETKGDDISHTAQEVVQETEPKPPRGFYLFYGVGYGHAQNIIDLEGGGGTLVVSMSVGVPAVGYRFSEDFALESRIVLSNEDYEKVMYVAIWLLEGKYSFSSAQLSPYVKVGVGLDMSYSPSPWLFGCSLAPGFDYYLSGRYSFGVEMLGTMTPHKDGVVKWFLGGNVLVRYHF